MNLLYLSYQTNKQLTLTTMNTTTITNQSSHATFSFEITYLRDTDYSFTQTTKRSDGKSFSRKLERSTPEYGNTIGLFAANDIELSRGNTVIIIEKAGE